MLNTDENSLCVAHESTLGSEIEEKPAPEKSLQFVHRTAFLKVKNNRNYYRIIVSLD